MISAVAAVAGSPVAGTTRAASRRFSSVRASQAPSPTTRGVQSSHNSGHALAMISGPMPATSPIVINNRGRASINYSLKMLKLLQLHFTLSASSPALLRGQSARLLHFFDTTSSCKGEHMLRNILVPLDGSTFGEQALPLALSIAGRTGAILHLLHVHRPLEATYAEMQVFDATLNQQIRDREKAYLQATSAAVRAVAKTQVTAFCKNGDIETTIRNISRIAPSIWSS